MNSPANTAATTTSASRRLRICIPDTEFGPEENNLPAVDEHSSLEAVLNAWNDATLRLQETHEVLREEVARLTDELEAKNRELARENRLADLGRMASHVAHEVRNSLVPVTLYLNLLNRRLANDPASLDILTKVEAGFAALDTTVNDLLNFTSHREPQWSTFPVRTLVEEVCQAVGPQLTAQRICLETHISPEEHIQADREMMRRAVLNLVLNALDAMQDGGELVITSYTGSSTFELEIADSGSGLDQDQLLHLFDPFFTTKSSGTGLGLAIVQRIVEAHGGNVTAANCPEGGAALTIEIPKYAMGAAA